MLNFSAHGSTSAQSRGKTNQQSSEDVSGNRGASSALQLANKQDMPVVRKITGLFKADLSQLTIR